MSKRNKQNEDYTKVGHNYKGIFYNEEEPEERYFEFGAHFRYADLYRRLERLKRSQELSSQIAESAKPAKESSRNHNDKLAGTQAAHSNININMNNFFITDHSKSRNHTKSRNTHINENYSLQIQLDTALKASLKIQEEDAAQRRQHSSNKPNTKHVQSKVINLVSQPYRGPIGMINSNEHRKFSTNANKAAREMKLTKVITITKGDLSSQNVLKKASKGTNSDLILSNNTVERKKSSNSQFTTHKSHSKLHSEDRTCLNQTPHSNVNSLAKLRPSGSIKEIAAKKLKSVIHYGSHEESYNSSKKQVCQDTHVIRVQKNLESKASTKSRNNQLRAIVSNKTNADAQSRNKLKNSNTVSNVSYHETPNKVNATPQTKNSKYLAYKRNPDLKSRNAPINGTSLTYKKIRNSKILCPEEVQKKDESRVRALMNKSPIEKYENVHHSNVKVAVKPNNFLYSNVKKDKFKGNELHPKMITVKTSNAAKAKRIFI